MVISKKHNFLFIHVPKTAGTSLTKALEPYGDPNPTDRLSKIRSYLNLVSKNDPIYFPIHSTWEYAQNRLGTEQYEKMFTFAFVRNPWDRLVSYYHYVLNNPEHHRHDKVKSLNNFAEYVDFEIKRNKFSQSQLLVDKNGNLKVDFIGKLENLSEDFQYICEKIGIQCELPHVNKSSHKKYQDLYDEESKEKVAQHWADEIKLFSYFF